MKGIKPILVILIIISFCLLVYLVFFVLFPKLPYPLYPLEYTFPSESNAIIELFSTATSITFSKDITGVGTYKFDVFPVPNCP